MIVDREAIRRRAPAALAQLDKLARRISRKEALSCGVRDFADDIAQDLMLVLLPALDQHRENEEAIHVDTLCRIAARRIAIGYLRANKRMLGLEDEEAFDALLCTDGSEVLEAVEHEQELRAAVSAGQTKRNGHRPARLPINGAATPRGTREEPEVDAMTGRELRDIRLALGLSQPRMAGILHASPHSLRNYEYGTSTTPEKTHVPDKLAARVRRLQRDAIAAGHYDQPPFKTQLRGWLRMLGLPPNDYAGFAKYLNLCRSTVWRWMFTKAQPPSERIAAINLHVEEIAARRTRRAEAIEVEA